MLTKTKVVLAAALMLGTASTALAGHVVPGSMDGVNPIYHPRWFPQYGQVMRAYDRANAAVYSGVGGYYPSASQAYNAYGLAHLRHHSPR
jgi:hypothetical protein